MATEGEAAWVECPDDCGDYVCTIHGGHVFDCECPEIIVWAEWGIYPYDEGSAARALPRLRPMG
jgi:hypothetical protein